MFKELHKTLEDRLHKSVKHRHDEAASQSSSSFGVNPHGTRFIETNLVTDGLEPAANTDPKLVNPWGVAEGGATGPFWVSDNNSGFATVYTTNGTPFGTPPLQVTIATPMGQTSPASPTGVVFNPFQTQDPNAFLVDGKPAAFIFATEDGTISGWNSATGTHSVIKVDNSNNPLEGSLGLGAVYKGLAIANTPNGPELFAANFRHGTVDVFNSNFQPIGSFTDPNVPKGYAPFNVQVLNGKLFVTFALQNAEKHDDVAGLHHGFVDEFNLDGTLNTRIASGGPLDSPWGLTIAPQGFGAFSGDLLVGNFGSGKIDAFNLTTDHFDGQLLDADGKPLVIQDLWDLIPGNGGLGGNTNTIYFTAGVQNEAHGLFGALNPGPNFNAPSGMSVAMTPHGLAGG